MITKTEAQALRHGQIVYHIIRRDSSGKAMRARVNGRITTWKTRPEEFSLPMKYGLRHCFYISQLNAESWSLIDPTTKEPT